jgi:hypothetical protein
VLLVLETAALSLILAPAFPFGDPLSTWATPLVLLAVAVVAVATTTDRLRLRRIAAVAMLAGGAAMAAWYAAGYRPPVGPDLWGDARYAVSIAAVLAAAAIGTAFRRRWARWIGIALGVGGAATSGLNLVPVLHECSWHTWVLATSHVGGLALVVALAGSSMAEADAISERDRWWDAADPLVRRLRAAVVTSIVAVPMLLLYAWSQTSTVASIAAIAPWLAAFMAVSTMAAVRGRVWGALGLAVAGFSLLACVVCSLAAAHDAATLQVSIYYAIFWVPAACVCVVTGVAVGRAIARLRRP